MAIDPRVKARKLEGKTANKKNANRTTGRKGERLNGKIDGKIQSPNSFFKTGNLASGGREGVSPGLFFSVLYIVPLKIPVFAAGGFLGPPGFTDQFVPGKLLFNIMAGPAFVRRLEELAFVLFTDVRHMRPRIEILMDMAILAILVDDFIVLDGIEFPFERLDHVQSITSRDNDWEKPQKGQNGKSGASRRQIKNSGET